MNIEQKRQKLQESLDSSKTQAERNLLGQFATPYALAHDIMSYTYGLLPKGQPIAFLEPAIGTGVFYSSLSSIAGEQVHNALGFEIDPHYAIPAQDLWIKSNLNIKLGDFLEQSCPEEKFSFLVSNPPYSRHHHIGIERKRQLQQLVFEYAGIKISGLAGLYCYFLILSTKWLQKGALSCWLIPSEFMDVNFGKAIKQFLLHNVNLYQIHRFHHNDLQFSDALVTSSIVIFKNELPANNDIIFSTGEKISNPLFQKQIPGNVFTIDQKWSLLFSENETIPLSQTEEKLGNYFEVKRGLATGNNEFFIVDEKIIQEYQIPEYFLVPILPSSRYISDNIVNSTEDGSPSLLTQKYLFSCSLSEEDVKNKYPGVWRYIQLGISQEVHKGYICSHRKPWYSCEKRKPAVFLMNYMGRNEKSKNNTFKFIWNRSNALATNVFLLLYPKASVADRLQDAEVQRKIWLALNNISSEEMINCGRVYGGGLHKLEPKEFINIPAKEIAKVFDLENLNKPAHLPNSL